MKRLVLLFCLLLVGSAVAQLGNERDYSDKYVEWEKAAYSDAPSADQVTQLFSALKAAWATAPEKLKQAKADTYAVAALRTAELSLDGSSADVPAQLLGEAGRIAKTYSFELGRGRSSTAFDRAASIQARVAAKTNRDPLAGAPLGYEFGELSDGYYAIQQSLQSEREMSSASQYPIENLQPNESAGTLLRMNSDGVVLEKVPVTLVDGSSPLRVRLKTILRYRPAGPDGPGRFLRQEPESFFAAESSANFSPTMERSARASVEKTTPGQTKHVIEAPMRALDPEPANRPEPFRVPALPSAIVVVVIAGILVYVLRRRST